MALRKVKNARRKTRRDIEKVFSKDFRKILTEIVTNSDDSYRRMGDGDEEVKSIQITVNKSKAKRSVQIVDNAEGMNKQDLDSFDEYGGDRSGRGRGHKTRGLYGQGASDVLFYSALHTNLAEIKSIKDDDFYTCKFLLKDDEKHIHTSKGKVHLRDIRRKFSIPENGTIVSFGIPEKVSIPNNLQHEVESFYMLRFICNDPKRNIILNVETKSKTDSKVLKYEFPKYSDDDVLIQKAVYFDYEGNKLEGNLTLIETSNKNEEKYGEQKILIYDDEKNVYENSYLGFNDKNPGTERLYGYLELKDTAKVIRDKLNHKDSPEEILTDTRDGFDRKSGFYKNLEKAVNPEIERALKKINAKKGDPVASLDENKDWQKALQEINDYFKENLEEQIGAGNVGVVAPATGLKFIIPSVKITKGKKYSTRLLINTDKIPIGTKITISSESDNIEFSPKEFILNKNDVVKNNLARKTITIKGLLANEDDNILNANSVNDYNAKLFINVINEDIHYPKYGLEFWPDRISVRVNSNSSAKLYFDTEKFPIGSEIQIKKEGDYLDIQNMHITTSNSHLISSSIGVVGIQFKALSIGKIEIYATCKHRKTKLLVISKNIDPPPPGTGGFINGVDLKKEKQFWATYYDPNEGKININVENNANQLHLSDIDLQNPKFGKEHNKYLAELCASEAAKQLVKTKLDKGHLDYSNLEESLDEIQREKNKLFEIFIRNIGNILK